jgi:hypothetical protein
MPDVILDRCYESLFSGLPLMRLRNWWSFESAHDSHNPPIVGLAEFNENFDDVLQLFRANNFAQEYVTRYPNEHTTRFAGFSPPRAQDSPAQCESRLCALRSTIGHLGADAVENEINRLVLLYHTASNSQMDGFIRSFILQNHDQTILSAPTYGGAHFRISQLLRRIQDL